jgi:ubiquinone/menaquinone biosynthesis C-methylase UbiE
LDVRAYNRQAWNHEVERGNPWTVPVGHEVIEAARKGEWQIVLTNTRRVPHDWFPVMAGLQVLCLASGGGQQAPVLAAAGGHVTVLDNSPKQLEQDRKVAQREGLEIRTVEGDMADLHMFPDQSFDLIIHPVSNVFVPAVRPVWAEAFRVLRPGGTLLAGFMNPVAYIFDFDLMEQQGVLEVRHAIPYSDLESQSAEKKQQYLESGRPLEFGHSLEDQIGGQLAAGFLLCGFYEDIDGSKELCKYISNMIATRAIKPQGAF